MVKEQHKQLLEKKIQLEAFQSHVQEGVVSGESKAVGTWWK